MSEITIRRATEDDVTLLTQFNVAMARETEDKALNPGVVGPGVRSLVTDERLGFYLVAETADRIAGCLAITFEWSDWRNGLFWWIQSVYVDPAFRQRGVFRKLYDNVYQEAAHTPNVCGIRLYVERENVGAQATYSRLGMTETNYRLFEVEFDHS